MCVDMLGGGIAGGEHWRDGPSRMVQEGGVAGGAAAPPVAVVVPGAEQRGCGKGARLTLTERCARDFSVEGVDNQQQLCFLGVYDG